MLDSSSRTLTPAERSTAATSEIQGRPVRPSHGSPRVARGWFPRHALERPDAAPLRGFRRGRREPGGRRLAGRASQPQRRGSGPLSRRPITRLVDGWPQSRFDELKPCNRAAAAASRPSSLKPRAAAQRSQGYSRPSVRYRAGVTPSRFWNDVDRWLWDAKPVCRATSTMGRSVDARRCFAFSTRRCSTYRCTVVP